MTVSKPTEKSVAQSALKICAAVVTCQSRDLQPTLTYREYTLAKVFSIEDKPDTVNRRSGTENRSWSFSIRGAAIRKKRF
jgi:hypothetical protein